MLFRKNAEMVDRADALEGRTDQTMTVPAEHHVNGKQLRGPWPDGMETLVVGMGCFWGAEKLFWETPGVYSTFVGYAGGYTPNPAYEEVCAGRTGHTEAVGIVFDPDAVSLEQLLKIFWEQHDPTQGMRQGNDLGSQYRSVIYATSDQQLTAVEASREMFQKQLGGAGFGEITTEVAAIDLETGFFYAEPYHQQYLAKNPAGYCPIHATGVTCR
jgi:peptide-methionine (S)-S-oxide reductase